MLPGEIRSRGKGKCHGSSPHPPKGPRRPGTAGSCQRRAELVALLRAPLPPSVPHGSHNLWGPCMAPWGPCTAPWRPYTSHVDLAQPCVDLVWPRGDLAQPIGTLHSPMWTLHIPVWTMHPPMWTLHSLGGSCAAHGEYGPRGPRTAYRDHAQERL